MLNQKRLVVNLSMSLSVEFCLMLIQIFLNSFPTSLWVLVFLDTIPPFLFRLVLLFLLLLRLRLRLRLLLLLLLLLRLCPLSRSVNRAVLDVIVKA